MKDLLKLKHLSWIFLFLLLLGWSCASQALPFSVSLTAGTSLPTFAVSGYPMSAYFTVTNTTGKNTSNNYIKYLPPNASIVPGANTCGATFNLAPQQSCTLHLAISGLVNGNDPDPRHHLFVCEQGGVTCAGVTSGPALNISKSLTAIQIVPNPATIPLGMTQAFTAIGIFSDRSSQNLNSLVTWSSSNTGIVTINASGVATGVTMGTATITATLGNISGSTTVTTAGALLTSITISAANSSSANVPVGVNIPLTAIGTYSDGTTQNITSTVTWNSSPPGIVSISTSGLLTTISTGTTSITAQSGSITSNSIPVTVRQQVAFLANNSGAAPFVYSCPFSNNTTFTTCLPNTQAMIFAHPLTITINPSGTQAYVVDDQLGSTSAPGLVYYCSINSTNYTLGNCNLAIASGTPPTSPQNIAFNNAGTFAYISNYGDSSTVGSSQVYICSVDANSGSLENCTPTTGNNFSDALGITLNAQSSVIYVTNHGANMDIGESVTSCNVNLPNGTLSNCNNNSALNSLHAPWNAAINNTTGSGYPNGYAYVISTYNGGSGNNDSYISYCALNGDGALPSSCQNSGALTPSDGATLLSQMAINPAATYVYYVIYNNSTSSTNNISYCPINNDGSLTASNCNPVAGLPTGILTEPTGVTVY